MSKIPAQGSETFTPTKKIETTRQTPIMRGVNVAIALFLLCLIVVMFSLFSITAKSYRNLARAHEEKFHAEEMVQYMYESSAALTRFARTYVVTANPRFQALFDNVLGVRGGSAAMPEENLLLHWDFMSTDEPNASGGLTAATAYQDLVEMEHLTFQEKKYLEKAHERSDLLAKHETAMMAQVTGNQKIPDYVTQLFNETYHQKKIEIMQDLDKAFTSIDQRMDTAIASAHAQIARTTQIHFIVFCASLAIGSLLLTVLYISRRRTVRELETRVHTGTEHLNQSLKELEAAHQEIKTLQGLIPICAYCHHIRNEEGAWNKLEVYLAEHSTATLSHGVCPNCKDILMGELDEVAELHERT